MNDLDHDLPRPKAFDHLGSESGLLHVLAELLDDMVIYIRFQQGLADLAHCV